MLEAVTLDRDHLQDFRERAKGLRRGPVQGHTIYCGLNDWGRGHSAWRGESGYLVCRLRVTLISLVGTVGLAACSEGSSVLERLIEPLLFRFQYRAARVVIEVSYVAFSGNLDPAFLLSRFGEHWYHSLESSQNNTWLPILHVVCWTGKDLKNINILYSSNERIHTKTKQTRQNKGNTNKTKGNTEKDR